MRDMETGANEQARLIVEQGMERCEAIKSISQDKLNRAVSLVVERIVNPYGNS
jgi:hypothetical protein